ncbi:MAG: GSCFA domain-containing protein [Bacteroidales bacterium]|nr:GSCFA domain-containing protein [Bacteroidales bacterium]
MIKLQTEVTFPRSRVTVSYSDKIMVLGSCFADNIGRKMQEAGFDVCVNPFGTLYNPVSICNSVARLSSGAPFGMEDCVQMGAGSPLVCSFSHHTSFARPTGEEFLQAANGSLERASSFFKQCSKVVVTLGTAWCFRHVGTGEIVSNCLKRDAKEFVRERMGTGAVSALLSRLVEKYPEKEFIFTVSPVRHLKDGAFGNHLSKASLLLAVESVLAGGVEYFPSYEIMMDELRDYRFYAEDMVHPSAPAIDYIWQRFCDFALPESEKEELLAKEKLFRQSQHRQLH